MTAHESFLNWAFPFIVVGAALIASSVAIMAVTVLAIASAGKKRPK